MSVLTELLENYESLPNEFKRNFLLMREIDVLQNGTLIIHSPNITLITTNFIFYLVINFHCRHRTTDNWPKKGIIAKKGTRRRRTKNSTLHQDSNMLRQTWRPLRRESPNNRKIILYSRKLYKEVRPANWQDRVGLDIDWQVHIRCVNGGLRDGRIQLEDEPKK